MSPARPILWLLVFTGTFGNAADDGLPGRFAVGFFSTNSGELPPGWQPLEFRGIPQHTQYTVVRDGEVWVLRALSDSSASGLIYPLQVDLRQYPFLHWRWKVQNVLEKGDLTRRSGDDYPARLYVVFDYEPQSLSFFDRAIHRIARLTYGDLPGRALNYIWANRTPREKSHSTPSPITDYSRLLVCRSPPEDALGVWFEEERNVFEDYQLAFGADPPQVIGIGLMTDTDNTGESAIAHYGDITFLREPN